MSDGMTSEIDRTLKDAIHDRCGVEIQKNIRLFACYHCSPGTISRNCGIQTQKRDWERFAIALKQWRRVGFIALLNHVTVERTTEQRKNDPTLEVFPSQSADSISNSNQEDWSTFEPNSAWRSKLNRKMLKSAAWMWWAVTEASRRS